MTNDEETLKILRKIHKEMKFDNDIRLMYPMMIRDPKKPPQLETEIFRGGLLQKTILGHEEEDVKCTG